VETFVSRTTWVAIAIALLAIALRAPLFAQPLERDEGEYAYIAWRISEGETPYLDWFDQKPPGVFLAYRVALAWPGDPVVAFRAVGALFAAGSALALFALARVLLGTAAAVVAALVLVFLSADPMLQGASANTEIFMVPGIVVSALLTLRWLGAPTPSFAAAVAIGLALGAASAFKQVAVVNVPFLIAVVAWRAPRGERVRRTARFAAGMAAGGLAVWGAILFWFWLRGGLAPALDAILFHNLQYTADLTPAERIGALRYFVPPLVPSQGVAWVLALVGLVVLARRRDRAALFLVGFAAANAIGVSASGFYFPHYFQELLPAVALLAAAAIAGGAFGSPSRTRLAAGAAVALVPPLLVAIGIWRLPPDEISRRLYPGNNFEVMPALAAEVAAHTEPGDRVFVFGSEPEILFGARRVSASRYIFLFPVFNTFSDVAERQASVIAEVEAARPAAIVWLPLQSFFGRGRPQRLTEWTGSYINESYRLQAFAVADAAGRSTIERIAPDADGPAQIAEHGPWAMVFVRTHD
jgi:4-amino-4-deoxy-L-arabinose transferase-like glycosyltransferase